MARKVCLFALAAGCLVLLGEPLRVRAADTPPAPVYKNPGAPVEERVLDLLGRMTPEEKAGMLSGSGWMESFPVPRLGIPAIKMADGPLGVRAWTGPSSMTSTSASPQVLTTGFPSGILMASSFDPGLVTEEGRAIGEEVKAFGRDMILGPTVNIQRTPLWGRNFEGYGEDPFLTSRMGVAYIRGVQSEGVIPSVKHFAANNQEFERHRIDVAVDQRTLEEIYYPAFRAAVQEAGVWAVMSAYNRLNGVYCAEDKALLTDTLRKRWGFKGLVVSDWGSTYSTAPTVNAGMDVEMPGGEPMKAWFAREDTKARGNGAGELTPEKVMAALGAGEIQQATVDENVRAILRVMFTAGLFDKPHPGGGEVDTEAQRTLARRAATEGMVLLKNEAGVLPFDPKTVHTLAVIGPNAAVHRNGGGSSFVRTKYVVTPLDGIKEAAGSGVAVSYALGARMAGEDAQKDATEEKDELGLAVSLAAKSDAAVVVVGNSNKNESEGFDRKSMDLPAGQDELISAVSKVNARTVVVVVAGAPVTMTRWLPGVKGVLYAWYGGQEAGHAIGDLLMGAKNPSGKLPVTFPSRIEDSVAFGHYPGENLHVAYTEGIYVGYRGFDKNKVEPLFPFGYGLSYTTFEYGPLKVKDASVKKGGSVTVSLDLKNSGAREGAEVVELYVHDVKASLDRPEKELKGFERVSLKPGETRTVSFTLEPAAMSFFDPRRDDWVQEPGVFEVLVGASSRDIRSKGSFTLVE